MSGGHRRQHCARSEKEMQLGTVKCTGTQQIFPDHDFRLTYYAIDCSKNFPIKVQQVTCAGANPFALVLEMNLAHEDK